MWSTNFQKFTLFRNIHYCFIMCIYDFTSYIILLPFYKIASKFGFLNFLSCQRNYWRTWSHVLKSQHCAYNFVFCSFPLLCYKHKMSFCKHHLNTYSAWSKSKCQILQCGCKYQVILLGWFRQEKVSICLYKRYLHNKESWENKTTSWTFS